MGMIFWDFDGTLAHSKWIWSRSVYSALCDVWADNKVDFGDVRRCMNRGFPWDTAEEDHSSLVGERWWEFMNAHFESSYLELGVSPDMSKAAAQKVRAYILNADSYTLYDDTISTLKTARDKGYTNVILSNNYPELSDIVDALGLSQYVDGVITSGLEGLDKPRRELFLRAMERYPSESGYFMVGDNPVADIEGGNGVGMTTVLVHRGKDEKADYCFDSLVEVLGVV